MNAETGSFIVKLASYVEGKVVAGGTENLDNLTLKRLK